MKNRLNRMANPMAMSQGSRATGSTATRRSNDADMQGDKAALIVESAAKSGLQFRFRVAADQAVRERAYRLAHEIYSHVSLAQARESGMVVSPYDAGPETFTLLAEDMAGTAVGTVSLVFDSDKGLPCDEIYWLETSRLRAENRRMAEVTRLAIRKDCEQSNEILLRLFNLIYIYARRVRRYTDFVIEVHPRHLKYYERAFGCEAIGGLRHCARVGGAPAMLGRIDLSTPDHKDRWVSGRTLYPRFWPVSQELAISQYLAAQYRPMTQQEARRFGLA